LNHQLIIARDPSKQLARQRAGTGQSLPGERDLPGGAEDEKENQNIA
jgi:hypothetical protein